MERTLEYTLTQTELLEILERHFRNVEGYGPKGRHSQHITMPFIGIEDKDGQYTAVFRMKVIEPEE